MRPNNKIKKIIKDKNKKLNKYLNEKIKKVNKIDVITILIIMIIYGTMSFYRLGNLEGINTYTKVEENSSIIFEFKDIKEINKIVYFGGDVAGLFDIYISNDNIEYQYYNTMNDNKVFFWKFQEESFKAKYIEFLFDAESSLGEVAFYDKENNYIEYKASTSKGYINSLNDEIDIIPEKLSYMNSTYFDEIYFANTAYQYVHNIKIYEWTHPPLGKLIQAIPILITGKISPFIYRMMNNISGILILLVMYVLGALLFQKRKYAIASSLIIMFDTFHFAQTRMGTVDGHLVLFILTSSLFMLLFCKTKMLRYLLTSGIFFGLSISVKWIGFYGGLALAIIYFSYLIKNKELNFEYIIYGSTFFVTIPLIIYCSIYLLFPNNYYRTDNLQELVKEQKLMYNYHSKLTEQHFFSSKWYSWPISYKPVWYHVVENKKTNTRESISCVGNLVFWIGGIIAFIFCLTMFITKKDTIPYYIIVSILSVWLPYAFISRVMFQYHYFSVLPFLALAIIYFIKTTEEKFKVTKILPWYIFLCILFFIIYYPVASGIEVPEKYIESLELFDSWYF